MNEIATAQLLATALAFYGPEEQMRQTMEECGELIVALSHYQRGRVGTKELAEEIAGVLIMVEQMCMLLPDGGLEEAMTAQLNKLYNTLSAEGQTEH